MLSLHSLSELEACYLLCGTQKAFDSKNTYSLYMVSFQAPDQSSLCFVSSGKIHTGPAGIVPEESAVLQWSLRTFTYLNNQSFVKWQIHRK